MAYYDYQQRTIRHVQCPMKISETSATKRCTYCKNYRDSVLRSILSRLLKQQDEQQVDRCSISSSVNYPYLSTPEKIERMHNLHNALRLSKRKISDLQKDDWIENCVKLDEPTSNGLLSILQNHQTANQIFK